MVSAPDLPGVIAAFNDAGARHVIIGGFAVIALQFIRATDDSDLLIPDDGSNHSRILAALETLDARLKDGGQVTLEEIVDRDHLRLYSDRHGIVDLLKEGAAPLDFETVYADSTLTAVAGVPMRRRPGERGRPEAAREPPPRPPGHRGAGADTRSAADRADPGPR